ncbi:hypothetical protein K439DRAFT_1620563 [Ramaria rubella]|nr:hypothetical protein K439DRAFT_1620563 [Ramaria rubella]
MFRNPLLNTSPPTPSPHQANTTLSFPAAGHYKASPSPVSPLRTPVWTTMNGSIGTPSHSSPLPCVSSSGTYAQPLSPLYATKLIQFEAEDRALIEHDRIRMKDVQAEQCIVRVKWWRADAQPCMAYRVQASENRRFHPSQCEEIIRQVTDCGTYEFFDIHEQEWVTTSLPLLVGNGDTLYLRSCGVTNCPGFAEFNVEVPKGTSLSALPGSSVAGHAALVDTGDLESPFTDMASVNGNNMGSSRLAKRTHEEELALSGLETDSEPNMLPILKKPQQSRTPGSDSDASVSGVTDVALQIGSGGPSGLVPWPPTHIIHVKANERRGHSVWASQSPASKKTTVWELDKAWARLLKEVRFYCQNMNSHLQADQWCLFTCSSQLPVNVINHLIRIQTGVNRLSDAPKTKYSAILRALQAWIAINWAVIEGEADSNPWSVPPAQRRIEEILQELVHGGNLTPPAACYSRDAGGMLPANEGLGDTMSDLIELSEAKQGISTHGDGSAVVDSHNKDQRYPPGDMPSQVLPLILQANTEHMSSPKVSCTQMDEGSSMSLLGNEIPPPGDDTEVESVFVHIVDHWEGPEHINNTLVQLVLQVHYHARSGEYVVLGDDLLEGFQMVCGTPNLHGDLGLIALACEGAAKVSVISEMFDKPSHVIFARLSGGTNALPSCNPRRLIVLPHARGYKMQVFVNQFHLTDVMAPLVHARARVSERQGGQATAHGGIRSTHSLNSTPQVAPPGAEGGTGVTNNTILETLRA